MRGDNGSGQHSKKCNFLSGRSIVPNAQYAIRVAQKIGCEIYSIGIMTNSINQLLPKTSLPIYNINELTEATFKLLQLTLFQRIETNIKIFY